MKTADYWVRELGLSAHPEGGFFKETYRSNEIIDANALPSRFRADRKFSTSIYFLLRSEDRSHFHRIKSDELWHYHAGASLSIYILSEGQLTIRKLGTDIENGESLQVVVPANSWFGAMVNEKDSYVLSGCTVSPGFDFNDFELAIKVSLTKDFPDHADIIRELTPE